MEAEGGHWGDACAGGCFGAAHRLRGGGWREHPCFLSPLRSPAQGFWEFLQGLPKVVTVR